MSPDEFLRAGMLAYGALCVVVVIAAMRQTDSWRVPDRDPARERREAYPCRMPAFASQHEAHVWSETRLAQTRERHSVYTCVEGHWHVGRER